MHKPILLKNLSLCFNHKVCFDNFSGRISFGDKIAIMGNNGAGKTTLLKALEGLSTPIEGEIEISPDTTVACVAQTLEAYPCLSGAERFNKALSLAIAQEPEVLLLDEPTNHLDLSNRKSLLRMLSFFKNTLIIVSHDPELLRQVNLIWHIENGKISVFSGNYDDYKREKDLKRKSLENQLNSLEKEKVSMHQKLMQEQERAAKSRQQGERSKASGKWAPIIAGGVKRKAQETAGAKKNAISERKGALNAQIKALGLPEQVVPSFELAAKAEAGIILFTLEGKAGYNDKTVLQEINLSLKGNERIAVIGDNASGKSTLLKAILNEQNRLAGTWQTPKREDIGYLDQHYNNINSTDSALTTLSTLVPSWTHAEIRKHLNDFLFRKNEEVNALIATLSGGEKARLSLAAIACKVPKLLLLDEITNNIDLQTREYVEQILSNYPAAMLVVSHDMDFINSIGIEQVYKVEDGIIKKQG